MDELRALVFVKTTGQQLPQRYININQDYGHRESLELAMAASAGWDIPYAT